MHGMTSRSSTLALALLCGLACDSSSTTADPVKAEAKPAPVEAKAAKTETKTDPALKTGLAPKTETKPDPAPKLETKPDPTPTTDVPETKIEPTPVVSPTGPVASASLAAGIDPPDQPRVLELARAKGLAKPTLAAKLAEAGSRRYIAAIRDRKGSAPAEYSLHLLLLHAPEPAPGAAVEWVADGVLELHRWSAEWLEDAEAGSIPTTLVVDDHERDGEIEALVRFRHDIMCPGGGPNTITELRIVELEPGLAVVLKTELHHAIVSVETTGTVHHEDLDADGHPDLRVRYSTKSEDDPKPVLAENRWRWVPADDTWIPFNDGAKLPPFERKGCDW
jgi:hypothetical protein